MRRINALFAALAIAMFPWAAFADDSATVDVGTVATNVLDLANHHKWWALGAVIIGGLTRLTKFDVTAWVFKHINVSGRWRPLVAVFLGLVLSAIDMIASTDDWKAALQWGLSAAVTAMMGHLFVVEVARDGRELGEKKDDAGGSGGGAGGQDVFKKPSLPPLNPPPAPYSTTRMVAFPYLATALLCLAFTACPKGGSPFKWPDASTCVPGVGPLVGQVTQVIFSDTGNGELSSDGKSKLEELAIKNGSEVVLCLVDQLVRDWTAPGASANPERAKAAARGKEFLKSTHATIYLRQE